MSVISIDRKKLQKGAIRHLRDRTPFNPLQEVEEAMRQLPYQKQGVCAARLILEGGEKAVEERRRCRLPLLRRPQASLPTGRPAIRSQQPSAEISTWTHLRRNPRLLRSDSLRRRAHFLSVSLPRRSLSRDIRGSETTLSHTIRQLLGHQNIVPLRHFVRPMYAQILERLP